MLQEAEKYKQVSKLSDAIQQYKQILIVDSNNLDADFNLGELYLRTDELLLASHHFYKVYIAKDKYFIDSQIALAETYYYMGDFEKAIIYFDELKCSQTYINENYLEIYINSLKKFNKFEDAINLCDEILQRKLNDPFALYIIGNIRHTQNFLQVAEQFLYRSYQSYVKRHQKTRSPFDRDRLKTVEQEYYEVKQKLQNQKNS